MPAIHPFPQPEASDPDSVADALDSGLLHWVKGEIPEALQCLRAAGAASAEAGSEQRALDLVRMASELTSKQEPAAVAAPAVAARAVAVPAVAANEAPAPPPSIEESKSQALQGRSRLPEPPSGPKKFTGSPESNPGMVAAQVTPSGSRASNPPKSVSAERASALSAQPAPPSARPPAFGSSSSGFASKSAGGNGSGGLSSIKPFGSAVTPLADALTPNQGAESAAGPPSATASPLAEGSNENGVASTSRKSVSASKSAAYSPTAARSTAAHNASATPDSRASNRPQGLDHRLASVRVKIERVESDGTIRLRQLDLAATASGEDNALLVVSQNLWQELKRGG